jgi:hypothetical protein
MTKHVLAALLLALVSSACGGGASNNAPPITDTVTAGDSSAEASAGTTDGGDHCGVFVNCALHDVCSDQACIDHCSMLTAQDGAVCRDRHCKVVRAGCEMEVAADCDALPIFCGDFSDTSSSTSGTSSGSTSSSTSESSTSSSTSESSSSSGGEPGPCDGYFNCLDECDDDPVLCGGCTLVLMDASQRECDALRCDELLDDCADGVPGTCLEYLEFCSPDDTSSTGGESSGGTATGTDTGATL